MKIPTSVNIGMHIGGIGGGTFGMINSGEEAESQGLRDLDYAGKILGGTAIGTFGGSIIGGGTLGTANAIMRIMRGR